MSEETRSAITASIAGLSTGSPDNPEPTPTDSEASVDNLDAIPAGAADDPEPEPAEPVAADPAADPAKPAEPAATEEDDDFSKVAEFEELKNGTKRVNRIPHPRVKKMIEAATKRAEATLRETLGKEHGEKLTAAEKRVAEYEAIGQIMATDPDRFVEMLATTYPAYKAYSKQAAADTKPTTPANDPEPQPDGQLPDGTPGYTPARWKEHQDWEKRQIRAELKGELQKEWQEKYGYLDKEREVRQAREAQAPVIRAQMAEAENWPGFKDHFDAIVTELRLDTEEAEKAGKSPKMNLHGAYTAVLQKQSQAKIAELEKTIEGLKTDRNKMRAEVLEELKKAPKSTAAVPAQHTPAREEQAAVEDGDSPTKATIKAAIRGIRDRHNAA